MDNSPVEMNLEELTLPQFELERTGTRPCKDLLKTGKHCPVKTDPTRILYMFLIVFCRFLRHVGTRFELVWWFAPWNGRPNVASVWASTHKSHHVWSEVQNRYRLLSGSFRSFLGWFGMQIWGCRAKNHALGFSLRPRGCVQRTASLSEPFLYTRLFVLLSSVSAREGCIVNKFFFSSQRAHWRRSVTGRKTKPIAKCCFVHFHLKLFSESMLNDNWS